MLYAIKWFDIKPLLLLPSPETEEWKVGAEKKAIQILVLFMLWPLWYGFLIRFYLDCRLSVVRVSAMLPSVFFAGCCFGNSPLLTDHHGNGNLNYTRAT